MGLRYTTNGTSLAPLSKSLHGKVVIRGKKTGGKWEGFSESKGLVLFSSIYRDDCHDYVAHMDDLFRLVATHPWKKVERRAPR